MNIIIGNKTAHESAISEDGSCSMNIRISVYYSLRITLGNFVVEESPGDVLLFVAATLITMTKL